MNVLNSANFNRMERTLDAAALRQKVIANNIANNDTPNFKRSDVVFEELLDQQMSGTSFVGKRTNPKHIPIGGTYDMVEPKLVQDTSSVMNNNLNNVDIDSEMTNLAKNQVRYNVITQQVNSDIRNLRIAIEGRK